MGKQNTNTALAWRLSLNISFSTGNIRILGTLYNQQYFICDWWFNVDCSTVEDFYSLNDDVAAAQIEAGK